MLGDDLNLTSLELQKYHLPGTTVLDAAEITPVGAALRLPVDLVAQLEQLLARADRDEDRWKDANVTLFKPTSLNKNREKNKKKILNGITNHFIRSSGSSQTLVPSLACASR